MDHLFESYKRISRDIGPIVYRNVVLLTNIIIYVVVGVLLYFRQTQAGIFLASTMLFAIVIGIIQDLRARLALEKLQLLTALRFVRENPNGTLESILSEQILKNDRIKLGLGDQIPCDGILLSARGLEVSNALLTGESESFAKSTNDQVLAGAIVTAGSGSFQVETPFADSRISEMTKNIKKYSVNDSPIQNSINRVIKYSGYLLMIVIAVVVLRGILVHDEILRVVENTGALASLLLPQGLILVSTIFFVYGAVNLLRKQVLLQELNAAEKIGLIKNLCLDKTGTLTENILVVEQMYTPPGVSNQEAEEQTAAYLRGSDDSSETIRAVRKFIPVTTAETPAESIPFSSHRQYGAVRAQIGNEAEVILIGAPDIFSPLSSESDQHWLRQLLATHTSDGKRLLCVARMKGADLPQNLAGAELSLVAVFVFYNHLRPGIQKVIQFFQARGVVIRVISGDNPATVRAVATAAGVNNTEAIITGPEIENWSADDFTRRTSQYTIFARINPEQKEKIIAGFKQSGFTAMVGDGANDALALKKADLGIAMFDGAQATRKLAAVVLMNNSFAALPDGVNLAENIIRNIEIMASVFINQVAFGFLFFVLVSALGFAFPFTPLNITLIDYFIIGFPSTLVFYWVMKPVSEFGSNPGKSFLRRVLPFALASSIAQAVAATAVFILSPNYLKNGDSNALAAIAFIAVGFFFLVFTPKVYQGQTSRAQIVTFLGYAVFEIVLLTIILKTMFLVNFFAITRLSGIDLEPIAAVLGLAGVAQYLLARRFSKRPITSS